MQARFLFLPEGEDPDTLVRKEGQQYFEQQLQSATPLSDFLLDHLTEQVDMNSMDGRARLSNMAKPLITKLSDGVFKELLVDNLSKRVGLSSETLEHHIPDNIQKPAQPTQQKQRDHRHTIQITPARLAIALILQYPNLAKQHPLPESLSSAEIPGVHLLLTLHNTIVKTNSTSPSALLERWRGSTEEDALTKLMQWDIPDSDNEKQRIKLFEDAISKLLQQHKDQRLDFLLNKSRQTPLNTEEKEELRSLSNN